MIILTEEEKKLAKLQIMANFIRQFWDDHDNSDYYDIIDNKLDLGYLGHDGEFIEISETDASWDDVFFSMEISGKRQCLINPDCDFIIFSSLDAVLERESDWQKEDSADDWSHKIMEFQEMEDDILDLLWWD